MIGLTLADFRMFYNFSGVHFLIGAAASWTHLLCPHLSLLGGVTNYAVGGGVAAFCIAAFFSLVYRGRFLTDREDWEGVV